MRRLGHRPELDGLRGIAILLVMLAHLGVPGFRSGGVTGVTLFFGLSGFLISSLLLEELAATGRIDLAAFYRRRALRLLPALITLLVVGVVWEAIAGNAAQTIGFAFVALLYFGNWIGWLGPWFGHTWSLAIEEQFYILWPALLLLGRPLLRRGGWTAGLLVCAAAAAATERALLWHGPASENRVYHGTDARCDALLFGAAVAVWFARDRRPWPRLVAVIGAGLLTVGTVATGTTDIFVVAPTLATVGSALVLAYLAVGGRGRVLGFRPLRFTGRISYGLYIWHVPLIYVLLPRIAGEPFPVRAVAFVGIAYGAALLSWRYIEQPFLRRKRRYEAGRTARVADAPGVSGIAAFAENGISPVTPSAVAALSSPVASTSP